MPPTIYSNFIEFLTEEINLSPQSIAVAQRSVEQNTELMPMVLWQYGLITIEQLDRICDWLEKF
ncbi:MAG: DUF2949 domain-containing protein [Cyanobacterium sp.]